MENRTIKSAINWMIRFSSDFFSLFRKPRKCQENFPWKNIKQLFRIRKKVLLMEFQLFFSEIHFAEISFLEDFASSKKILKGNDENSILQNIRSLYQQHVHVFTRISLKSLKTWSLILSLTLSIVLFLLSRVHISCGDFHFNFSE